MRGLRPPKSPLGAGDSVDRGLFCHSSTIPRSGRDAASPRGGPKLRFVPCRRRPPFSHRVDIILSLSSSARTRCVFWGSLYPKLFPPAEPCSMLDTSDSTESGGPAPPHAPDAISRYTRMRPRWRRTGAAGHSNRAVSTRCSASAPSPTIFRPTPAIACIFENFGSTRNLREAGESPPPPAARAISRYAR